MKGIFLIKRARPDVEPGFAFLSTRIKYSTEEDWSKLAKMMNYLKTVKNDILTLEADDTGNLYWHVDASFTIHPDMKRHTEKNTPINDYAQALISFLASKIVVVVLTVHVH